VPGPEIPGEQRDEAEERNGDKKFAFHARIRGFRCREARTAWRGEMGCVPFASTRTRRARMALGWLTCLCSIYCT
jgi:hypothetical protein